MGAVISKVTLLKLLDTVWVDGVNNKWQSLGLGFIRVADTTVLLSPTWCTVCELQVIQSSSSTHVPRADSLKYHFKVPQLPQGNLSSVPLIPLMPRFIPHLQQIVLSLCRQKSSVDKRRSCGGVLHTALVTPPELMSTVIFQRASKWIQS